MIFKQRIKAIVQKIAAPLYHWYAGKARKYRYRDVIVNVQPGVFHPGFFFSTKILLNHLQKIPLKDQNFLELGAGSGLISVYAAKQGAVVTASDISETAIQNIQENIRRNAVTASVTHSDLFNSIPPQQFDVIIINPPYYPRNPEIESQYAWFCGEDFQYFQRLFPAMKLYMNPDSIVLMILSEDCDIARIRDIASRNDFSMTAEVEKRGWWETNFIFRIGLDGS